MTRTPRVPTWVALALAAALASCGPGDVQEPAALAGHWEGRLTHRDATLAVDLDVEPSPSGFSARATVPALLLRELPLADFEYRSPKVRFSLPVGEERWTFDGWFRRSVLVGTLSGGSLPRTTNRGLLPQLALRRVAARPSSYGMDTIRIGGEGSLAGTLFAPADSLVHPGVVLVPEPDGGVRGAWREVADRFARAGFVVFAYDARGFGRSAGAPAASPGESERDAILALDGLRGRPGVDAGRVGVCGAFAGGALVPRAAAQARAAFAAAISPAEDPSAPWTALVAPALVLFGQRDGAAAGPARARRLREALAAAGRATVRVELVPRADRSLLLRPSAGEPFDFPRAAPGGLDTLLAWARRQAGLPPEVPPLVPPAR